MRAGVPASISLFADCDAMRSHMDLGGPGDAITAFAADGTVIQLETATSTVTPGTVEVVGQVTVGGKATTTGISTRSGQFGGAADGLFLEIDGP